MMSDPVSYGLKDLMLSHVYANLPLFQVRRCSHVNKKWNELVQEYLIRIEGITIPFFLSHFNHDYPLDIYERLESLTFYYSIQPVVLSDSLEPLKVKVCKIQQLIYPKEFQQRYPKTFKVEAPSTTVRLPCKVLDIDQLHLSDEPLNILHQESLTEIHIRSIVTYFPLFDLHDRVDIHRIFSQNFLDSPPLLKKITLCDFAINQEFINFLEGQTECEEIYLEFYNPHLEYRLLFNVLERLSNNHQLQKIHLGFLYTQGQQDQQFIDAFPPSNLPLDSVKIEICQYHFVALILPTLEKVKSLEIRWPLVSDIFSNNNIDEQIRTWFSNLDHLETMTIHLPLENHATHLIQSIPIITHAILGYRSSPEPIYTKEYFWNQLQLLQTIHLHLTSVTAIFSQQSVSHDPFIFTDNHIHLLNSCPKLNIELHEISTFDFSIFHQLHTLEKFSLCCHSKASREVVDLSEALQSLALCPSLQELEVITTENSPLFKLTDPTETFQRVNESTIKQIYLDFPLGLEKDSFIEYCCTLENIKSFTFSFSLTTAQMRKLKDATGAFVVCQILDSQ